MSVKKKILLNSVLNSVMLFTGALFVTRVVNCATSAPLAACVAVDIPKTNETITKNLIIF
jgi:hypothetical protein